MMALVAPLTTALTAFGAIVAASRRWRDISGSTLVRGLSAAAILGILVSGAMHRFANVDHLLWASDEMVTLMAGIRLHLLPLWNLAAADARENFFKSLVMPIHGLGDNVFFYLVVALFRTLHLPITEANLFTASAVLAVATLALLFLFVRRLFGLGAAVLALALAAWNHALIDFSTKGFQINFVIFLQVASLYAYVRHVSDNRWRSSLLMALLMLLCAGSELFYMGPVFLLLHAATRTVLAQNPQSGARPVRLAEAKNAAVWGAYGLMLLVDSILFFYVGRRLPLTLFGQLAVKRHLGGSWIPHYGLADFHRYFNLAFSELPDALPLVLAAALLLPLLNRRNPYAITCSAYLVGLMALAYVMRFSLTPNFMHLIVPAAIVVSGAATHLVAEGLKRVRATRDVAGPLSGFICVSLVALIVAPWRLAVRDAAAESYQCVKAVGYALRELGQPNMDIRVMFLSDQVYIPPTMEYYTGMNASADDDQPTRIFHIREPSPRYVPSAIAKRIGIDRFDAYVDFTKEAFPFKREVLADAHALGLHEVYRIGTGEDVCATIWSPRALPRRTASIEEGNRGFDRTYAYWDKLFSSVNVGAFWYYDANY